MTADLRLALRQLRKAPGFSVTAILTLALAIGANAIVFSVLNALVLRPLNVQHPESLFMVERNFGEHNAHSQAYPDYLDLRDRSRSFESLVSYDITGAVGLDTGTIAPSFCPPNWSAAITSTPSESSPISAASSTPPTNTARTAYPSLC